MPAGPPGFINGGQHGSPGQSGLWGAAPANIVARRAVRLEDKERKRERLLRAAATLLGQGEFERISMARIARQAGVAKGTLYLYFETKEELFLELHRRDYAAWFGDWLEQLRAESDTATPERLAAWMVQSLRGRERFLRLLAIVSTLLERNVGPESARAFKLTVLDCVLPIAPELQRILGLGSAGDSFPLLAGVHALLTGLWHNAVPAPVVVRLLETDPKLALFRMDYYALLEENLCALFNGARRRGRRR